MNREMGVRVIIASGRTGSFHGYDQEVHQIHFGRQPNPTESLSQMMLWVFYKIRQTNIGPTL